jgi:hypothetical protein
MNTALIIGLFILFGGGLALVLHYRSVRHMTPILSRLAAEENGEIKSYPFIMPKLLYSRSGINVEVSNASTGIDGQSIEYTYVLFDGMPSYGFKFTIRPRSILTVTDEWTGFKKPMDSDIGKLKELFAIYTNDDVLMQAILDKSIQDDLLFWTDGGKNRISDIRNYDGQVIYAVTGMLDDYEGFRLLLDSASRFVDRFTCAVSNVYEPPNDI